MSAARRRARGYAKVSKLRRKLRTLPDEFVDEARAEFSAIGDAILADAQARVPVKEGTLKRWLRKRLSRDGLAVEVGYITKAQKRRAFYAAFVEFGTRPSKIGGFILRNERGRIRTRKAKRSHPGTPPRPFLGPAFRANRAEALKRVRKAVNRALRRGQGDPIF